MCQVIPMSRVRTERSTLWDFQFFLIFFFQPQSFYFPQTLSLLQSPARIAQKGQLYSFLVALLILSGSTRSSVVGGDRARHRSLHIVRRSSFVQAPTGRAVAATMWSSNRSGQKAPAITWWAGEVKEAPTGNWQQEAPPRLFSFSFFIFLDLEKKSWLGHHL